MNQTDATESTKPNVIWGSILLWSGVEEKFLLHVTIVNKIHEFKNA